MKHPCYSAGIDIASDSFVASISSTPGEVLYGPETFENNLDGFKNLINWFSRKQITPPKILICMEATGVYGELLCHCLYRHHYPVVVESPLKVKRAFKIDTHKTDAVDSAQIAEYGLRFFNQLTPWQPREALLEQLNILINSRELLVQQRTQTYNHLHSLKRKVVQSPHALASLERIVETLTQQIKKLEDQIKQLIGQNVQMQRYTDLLKSIPGVNLLLAANLLVMTNGFTRGNSYRQAASYLKLAPLKHESGTSVYRKPRTPRYGPSIMRKLLSLAALSVVTHKALFRQYYLRKQAEGKPKRLILNNVENKLLKIIWAIIREQKPYNSTYCSIHPRYVLST